MAENTVRIVQIGCGYWGPNVLRNLVNHSNIELVGVIDTDPQVKNWIKEHYPDIPVQANFDLDLLDHWQAQAVVIATPAHTHYDLAIQVLSSGRHCLVEKPLARTSKECEALIKAASSNGQILMVGHTFLYNSVVRELRRIIKSGDLGEIYYSHAQRLNLGRIRKDIDVAWNLAPHDISILIYLFDNSPVRVAARGVSFIQKQIADVAFLELEFPDGKYALIHVSWLDPQKIRRITIVGSEKMAVYDDVAEKKLTIYDKGVDRMHPENATLGDFDDFGTFQLRLRAGGITIPQINFLEPLKVEVAEFINAISENRPALTDGTNGLLTVRVLEAVSKSMANNGKLIEVLAPL
ncbi:MAG: Gfo/Idh/MocA family oxidoreductase [Candidatus Marinimicrobia bacterium]|nr:Gfo/Idh/MocA family oxidoreductase [Candidatus Neomarinimicrobiota bacterium]